MTTSMTSKAFYTAVIEADLSAEITAKAQALLSTVEKKSAKASAKSSATQTANLEIAKGFAESMAVGTVYAVSELVALTGTDLSTSKVSAVCKVAVESGLFTVVDGYKVGGKGRAVKGYTLAEGEGETFAD